MNDTQQDPIDSAVWSELLDLAGADDPMMIAELIDSFGVDAEQQLEGMQTAVANGDSDAVLRCAHALRSPSASLGANLLAELCRKLEQTILEDREKADIRADLLESINTEYRRVIAALHSRHPANVNPS
jgi:HPt (histidine-containing phosphotransfer) domain-containing protein